MKRMLLWVLAVLVSSVGVARAQSQTGQVFGKVTDQSGALLPGVTVTLTSPIRLQPATAVTSQTGSYQFPGLAIGTYEVKFELSGFRTLVRQNIRIEIGFNAQVNAQLELAALEQTIEVVGTSPIVDVTSTAQGLHLGADALQALPSARDQYAVIQQAPGIAPNMQNVGGNSTGLQTIFMSNGANVNQTKWVMDGADLSPAGQSNGWFTDFDAIQEMHITTSGADATVQSPGANINIVSKSGSDRFRGSARYYVLDQRFEATNLSDALRRQGASSGNPLQHENDPGFEIGGPLVKGRAWFWGGASRQAVTLGVQNFYQPSAECAPIAASPLSYSFDQVTKCMTPDVVSLPAINYKIGVQLMFGNTFTFTNRYDAKLDPFFRTDNLHPASLTYQLTSRNIAGREPLWNTGWPDLWKFADQHVVNDRWLLEFSYSHFTKSNQFALDNAKYSVQPEFEISTGAYERSFSYTQTYEPDNIVSVATNYFRPGKWGGDHSFKAGYSYKRNESEPVNGWGGDAVARFNSSIGSPAFTTPFSAFFYRQSITDGFFYQQSAYLQDTYKRKRLTLTLGVRWDRQHDRLAPANVPASPFQGQTTQNGAVFNFLPAVAFPGVDDGGAIWNNFVPRIGTVYDLSGNGKTAIKASFSVYYDQRSIGQVAGALNTIGLSFVEFPWADLNGDKFVQANEVNTNTLRSFGGQYNPANPAQTVSPNQIDPGVRAPRTNEFVVGVSREVAADFGVSLDYIWRRSSDFLQNRLIGITSADYTPFTFTPAANACPAGARCDSVTYFAPKAPLPAPFLLTNQPDAYRRYQGIEATMRKRFSKRWMMNASYAFSDAPAFFTSPAAYLDPTNIAQQNGAQYAPGALNGNITINLNSQWIARMSGQYRTWHDIGVSAVLDARQGYPFEPAIQVLSRPNSAGAVNVLLDQVGSVRLPNLYQMDFRVDKSFAIRGHIRIEPAMDIFNLFNNDTVLQQITNQNAANANAVTLTMAARVARFGCRITF